MNRRERILAMTALAVVIVVGGGVLVKFLFWDSLAAVNAQIAAAEDELDKKQAELTKEHLDRQAILRRDPRLAHWQHLSLPADKNQEKELKAGWAIEEVKKRHDDKVQVDYDQFLRDLVKRSGFTSIKVSPVAADSKGAPLLTGKTPAYTRLSFSVEGDATLDAVVKMLREFYGTPLLHEVRSLTLKSLPQQTRPAPATGPPALGAPGGPPGLGAGGRPGRSSFGSPAGGALHVNMILEALLVTGADKRDPLLPESAEVKAEVLPDPARHYTDMLIKNMFTGVPSESKLTEDPNQVLSAIRLTGAWNGGRRWEASYYYLGGDDQFRKAEAKRLTESKPLNEVNVEDRYHNHLVAGKVVEIDVDGLVLQVDKEYYRWPVGEFLGPAMKKALTKDQLKQWGVSDN